MFEFHEFSNSPLCPMSRVPEFGTPVLRAGKREPSGEGSAFISSHKASRKLRMIPDPSVLLENLSSRQTTFAFSVRKFDQLAACHQFGPTQKCSLRVNVMLPSLPVN
jgi:hypothetical protein